MAWTVATPGSPQDFRLGGTPVKLQVVITRGEGDKKIREPYSLLASSSGEVISLRIGHEVPVSTTGPNGQSRYTLQQVGTQIDVAITSIPGDGRYKVQLTVTKRLTVDRNTAPTFYNFVFAGTLLLKNGETAPIIATDLVTNETWQTDLTVSEEK